MLRFLYIVFAVVGAFLAFLASIASFNLMLAFKSGGNEDIGVVAIGVASVACFQAARFFKEYSSSNTDSINISNLLGGNASANGDKLFDDDTSPISSDYYAWRGNMMSAMMDNNSEQVRRFIQEDPDSSKDKFYGLTIGDKDAQVGSRNEAKVIVVRRNGTRVEVGEKIDSHINFIDCQEIEREAPNGKSS